MSRVLKPVTRHDGKRLWCGPASLMAVTGKPYEEIRALINSVRGRRPRSAVLGMDGWEYQRCLDRLKIRYTGKVCIKRPTLRQWINKRKPELVDSTIIVALSEHMITVRGFLMVDNHTEVPTYILSGPWLRCRVQCYWILED